MTPVAPKNLKLFGLPRTFTNWLAYLVDANFRDVRCWHMTGEHWKHGPAHEVPRMDGYLICVKDPFAWIDSMLRYRGGALRDLVRRWNEVNGQYLEWDSEREDSWMIQYHRFLERPEDFLLAIATRQGFLTPKGDWSATILQPNTMGRSGDEMRHLMTPEPFDATHYTQRRYLRRFTAAQIRAIRGWLDRDLCAALGYEVEEA